MSREELMNGVTKEWRPAKAIATLIHCSLRVVYEGLKRAERAGEIEKRVVEKSTRTGKILVREYRKKEEML